MNRTIELAPRASNWMLLANGIINSFIGMSQIVIGGGDTSWQTIFGVALVVCGVGIGTYSIILLRSTRWTPKISIDDSFILIKEDVYKKARRISWESIKAISYKPFELNFLLRDNRMEYLNLHTNADISIKIKRAIREYAVAKQIEVSGG